MVIFDTTLLPIVTDKKLIAQHRHLCKIRQNSWKKPTPKSWFYNLGYGDICWYHENILAEMNHRGWKPNPAWYDYCYRGKSQRYEKIVLEADPEARLREWNPLSIDMQRRFL